MKIKINQRSNGTPFSRLEPGQWFITGDAEELYCKISESNAFHAASGGLSTGIHNPTVRPVTITSIEGVEQ